MIYLFDRQKKLQKIIPKKHLLSAIQTVELNGLYQLSVEVPLFYETKEGTQYNHKKNIEKAWFAGHYDRQKRFQLYKIHSRKVRADNKRILLFDGVHIFFDEAKAMGNIHDRRFRDSEMKPAADAAFNPIGWYVKDYDVTDRADITFYRDSVANARSLIIEKYGVEFDYGLTFDGRKIISKDLYIKKRLGRWTGKRFAYGSNLLSLTQEEDESEVYTAAVGRGKGEETGEGHGPRIEFTDIEWSRDGITKPPGQNYIEIPSATAEYGYYENGEIHPRIASEVVFENTENKQLLADSTYYWLLENCVPKALWKTDVAKADVHDLGDGVGVIYKKANIVKKARVHKMENNLLNHRLSKIILGDYQHFKTDKRQQSITAQLKRNRRDSQSYITQLKNDFDVRYDAQATAIENAYQQAVIDANAETAAAEERMNTALSTQWSNTESAISTAKTEAVDSANAYSDDVESRLNTSINTQRTEIESAISTAKTDATSQAESDATQKAGAVQDDLETYKQTSQQRLETLAGGDVETVTKNLREVISDLEQKVNNTDFATLEGELDTTKTNLQKQLDDAKVELDGLEVGGRNLVRNSEIINHEYDTNQYLWTPKETGVHVISFDYEVYEEVAEITAFLLYSYATGVGTFGHVPLKAAGDNRTKLVFDVTEVMVGSSIHLYAGTSAATSRQNRMDFIKLKVETGNIATDWTPAPEDTEAKISTINQELTNIDGRLQAKLEQTDIQPISDKVNEHSNTLTVTAQDITALQEKNALQDGDITTWSNETKANAQGLSSVTTRVSETESGLSTARTDIQTNAGEISTLLTETDTHTTKIASLEADVDGITTNVADLSDWKSQKGSVYDQTADAVSTKVWSTDISQAVDDIEVGGRNYMRNSGEEKFSGSREHMYYGRIDDALSDIGDGETITISFDAKANVGDYLQVYNSNRRGQWYFTPTETLRDIGTEWNRHSFNATVKFDETSTAGETTIEFFGRYDTGNTFYIKNIKIEKGNKATDWTPAPEDTIQFTDFELRSDGFLLGTTHVGGEDFATAIVGDAAGMSMIADNVDFSNNITVQNQIKSWSIESVKADFASATIDYLTTGVIKNSMLDSEVVSADKLLVNTAMVDKFTANTAFIDDIKALSIEAAKGSFGDIVAGTADLQFIENKHLATESVDADKLLVDSALVNKLTVNTAFISDIKAMSIEAVHADLTSVNSEIMTTNILRSEWLDVDTALFDRITSSEAFIDRLEVKAANIRDIQSIEIDTSQLNVTTIMDEAGQIAGGISIMRPDGAVLINNGVPRFDFASQQTGPTLMTSGVSVSGQYYSTGNVDYSNNEAHYFQHRSRYVRLRGYAHMYYPSGTESSGIIRVTGFSGETFEGTQYVPSGTTSDIFIDILVDLGIPDYSLKQLYIQSRVGNSSTRIRFRRLYMNFYG
ncbi:phage tail spike protein [Salinicoccus roseus]|uniref:phage tail spike protein n=1 Tax=Salinicoccus roseus TaxID=45670 RepID=UPI003568784E